MFNNKYTENIQNETGIRSIEIHSVGIIVLITTTSSDAIWATITSTTLSLSTYNLIERQMRFKSVRYRSAYSVIRQKKTERPITGSSVQNDLTKKIKITDLLTKGSFEENLVFWVYCCCYLTFKLKTGAPSSQTSPVLTIKFISKQLLKILQIHYIDVGV